MPSSRRSRRCAARPRCTATCTASNGPISNPLIGITTSLSNGKPRPRPRFVRAIRKAGGLPVLLFPGGDRKLRARIDGLLLTGGGDVDPKHYGQPRHATTRGISRGRDTMELGLIRSALKARRPVLAICRGQQLLNVALGGTLYQDIPSDPGSPLNHAGTGKRDAKTHRVALTGSSRLARLVGTTALQVNTFHHQAIHRLGRGLRVVARAGDGVIEGVEPTEHTGFLLAVQWHPEELVDQDAPSRDLFRAFIVAAIRQRTLPRA